MKTVRCAIYTRKSSDEGLEQDFNSLDAQREACAAYVLSQASEGWKLVRDAYDDGGLSGGTLERPALQRLLSDIRNGAIDIIVVYKVDRLTRSLLDFAKLVDTFDAANTSFVSVTQSFNTTTSMGRLTLNMLLSFAQFEREVTAERIRDKIAASKAKGMWMGGMPPLGYRPEGRSLAIVEEHAVLVRDIFRRYRDLGNVRLLADGLASEGIISPPRVTGKGQPYGGGAFTRGQLYAFLRNPIYIGMIKHKETCYQGNHPAIIEQALWDDVQTKLTEHIRGTRQARENNASLLSGLLFDAAGKPLIAVHTNKGRLRYRYYVSKAHQHGIVSSASPALRLPAREIEQVVRQELASLLTDPLALIERCQLTIAPTMLELMEQARDELRAQLEKSRAVSLKTFVERIIIHPDRLEFAISVAGLGQLLGVSSPPHNRNTLTHRALVRLTRTGRAVRLVQEDGVAATRNVPDPALVKLLIKARRWWNELQHGEIEIKSLAFREKVSPSYVTRVVRLAFLSPDVVEAVLAGRMRASLDGTALLGTGMVAGDWKKQAAALLPASTA